MTNRSLLPLLSLAVLATAVGCALPGADRCQSAEDCAAGEAALDDLLGSLPARWPAPPAERLELLDSSTTTTDDGGERVVCTEDTYVSQRTFHDLMALGDQYARVQPGMVVQGASLADGRFRAVPLPRGPVALTIELPLEEPTRALEEPSSTSLQAAVASLQRDADAELGSLPDLPARVSYSSEIVQSFEEATLAIDVSLSYSDSLRSAGLDAGFSSTDRRRSHTVIARLFQPMYTIAVADDEIATARDFFAPDLSEAAVEAQRAAGTIGPDNLPAYVHSVTYGRIVVFTMTSEEVESAEDLYAAVEGSFRGFEGDASAEASYRSVVSRSQVRVLALGGSADAALEAIRAGDYAGFFGPASASTAVPLSYEVRYLGGTREAAVIGQELEYGRGLPRHAARAGGHDGRPRGHRGRGRPGAGFLAVDRAHRPRGDHGHRRHLVGQVVPRQQRPRRRDRQPRRLGVPRPQRAVLRPHRAGRRGQVVHGGDGPHAEPQRDRRRRPARPGHQRRQPRQRQRRRERRRLLGARAPRAPAVAERRVGPHHRPVTTWWLRAEDGTRIRIEGGGALLGRAADCDVVLTDERASRRHALVYAAGDRASVVQLGRVATTVDGAAVDGELAAVSGARIEVPGLTLVLESDAGAPAAREWLLQRDGGGLFGVSRAGFRVGGPSDDVHIEGWPAGALVLTPEADGRLTLELGADARVDDREAPAGSVETCAHGTRVELLGVQVRLLGGHIVGEGTTVSQEDPAEALPVRARLEFLPRGARLHLEDARGSRVAYLPERRAELVSLLLAPPEPYVAGGLVPDEVLLDKLWPRQSKTNNDLHVLVHRVRKSLVAAGLDGVRLVAREPRAGGTSFELAPGAVVSVD